MQALQLLNEGKLDESVESAIELVRNEPANTAAREILAELFCLKGDLVRADKQLESILMQQPEAAVTSSLLRQLIRGETARRECWTQARVPDFVGEPSEMDRKSLLALVAHHNGDATEAHKILSESEQQRPALSGKCNGQQFQDFRDLDDLCMGILEVVTSTGKYYWVPFGRIQQLEFEAVSRPRDLLWRQCHLVVEDGPDGVVYIPALYVNTDSATEGPERLGRSTDWIGQDGEPIQGKGQRLFLVDEEERGIMEIETLQFDQPGSDTGP